MNLRLGINDRNDSSQGARWPWDPGSMMTSWLRKRPPTWDSYSLSLSSSTLSYPVLRTKPGTTVQTSVTTKSATTVNDDSAPRAMMTLRSRSRTGRHSSGVSWPRDLGQRRHRDWGWGRQRGTLPFLVTSETQLVYTIGCPRYRKTEQGLDFCQVFHNVYVIGRNWLEIKKKCRHIAYCC